MRRLMLSVFSLALVLSTLPACYSEDEVEKPLEDKENDDKEKTVEGDIAKSLEDTAKESIKGFGSWFTDASDNVKEKADFGLGAMRDWAGDVAGRFNKAKDKVYEAGVKVKETVGGTADSVNEEVGKAGSKVSQEAGKAFESMKSIFN